MENFPATHLADFDKLPKIEAKVAFLSLAASALSTKEPEELPPFEKEAWQGLAWITEEIRDELADWLKRI